MTKPTTPKHLTEYSKKWYLQILKDYELSVSELEVLKMACEALDTCEQARQEVQEHGLLIKGRYDNVRENPAVRLQMQAAASFAKLLKSLGLDEDSSPLATKPRKHFR